jgi:hypothetical protein
VKKTFQKIKNVGKHPSYWKVKAAFLQRQQTHAQARAAAQAADVALNQAMTEAGLDPAKQYAMNDADETITLKTA